MQPTFMSLSLDGLGELHGSWMAMVSALLSMNFSEARSHASAWNAQLDSMMAANGMDREGQLSKATFKAFIIGVALLFVAYIIVAQLAPIAYDQAETPSGNTSNVSDLPGGQFFVGGLFILLMLAVGVAMIVKAFDLV